MYDQVHGMRSSMRLSQAARSNTTLEQHPMALQLVVFALVLPLSVCRVGSYLSCACSLVMVMLHMRTTLTCAAGAHVATCPQGFRV